jgi:hypothetical protein
MPSWPILTISAAVMHAAEIVQKTAPFAEITACPLSRVPLLCRLVKASFKTRQSAPEAAFSTTSLGFSPSPFAAPFRATSVIGSPIHEDNGSALESPFHGSSSPAAEIHHTEFSNGRYPKLRKSD